MTPLDDLVCTVLGLAPTDLDDELSRTDTPGWTSMKHIELMVTLEERYSVSFTSREMAAVRTLGHLRELLGAKGCT